MDNIRARLLEADRFYDRSEDQVIVMDKILGGAVAYIYGKALYSNELKIKAYNRLDNIEHGVLLTAPRRFGKTQMLAIMIACLFHCVPGITISVISQSKHTAGKEVGILGKVLHILCLMYGYTEDDFKVNNEKHLIIHHSESDIRRISSFSADIGDGIRGIGGDIVVLEEAAYIDGEVVKQVVVPVLGVNTSCLVAISTLGKAPTNVFTKMLKSKFFYTHEVTYICADCVQAGMRDVCKHRIHARPHWMGDKDGLSKAIFGDDDDLLRENMGIMSDDGKNCFTVASVDRLFANPRCELFEPVRYIYIVVDPCAGTEVIDKSLSDFAIISICSPKTTILGIEAIQAQVPEHYENTLRSHCRRLRQLPHCENAMFVVDAEAGTGMEASNIQAKVREFENVRCMNDFHNGSEKVGTKTLPATKLNAMLLTRTALDMDDVRFHKDLVTHHKNPSALMQKAKNQFLQYERTVDVSKSMRSKNTVTFSGKGPNKNQPDDVCFTIQRAVLARQRFLYDPEFQDLH